MRMKKMCEEISGGCYTVPEGGIDVDTNLVLLLTHTFEVRK